jgi:23S rRNA-/tRNA-specific pseudouridylate synthase/SAM-dependent methyltransferase
VNPRRTHDHADRRPAARPGQGTDLAGVRVVHEDDDIIVVDKPPGLLTADPARLGEPNLFTLLRRFVKERSRRRDTTLWIIHRLDREASGLLVFAKTVQAFENLKDQFQSKKPHRLYFAVTEGEFPAPPTPASVEAAARAQPSMGTIQTMMREVRPGVMESVPVSAKIGKEAPAKKPRVSRDGGRPELDDRFRRAVTHYRVVATGRGRSLVQVRLETGLKNQIRVHMSGLGHPIVGDDKYGNAPAAQAGRPRDKGGRSRPALRLCLHAAELGFVHPGNRQTVRYASSPPPAFYRLVGAPAPAGEGGRHAEEEDAGRVDEGGSVTADVAAKVSAPSAPERSEREESVPSGKAGWDHVAGWYEDLLTRRGSDHHDDLVIPGVLRLLAPAPGERILDIACGEGELCRRLAVQGVEAVGVDLAPSLVEAARAVGLPPEGGPGPRSERNVPESSVGSVRFEVGDARSLDAGLGVFDAATSVLALMNIEPLRAVVRSCAAVLKPDGRLVVVVLHPAFRAPGQTSWGWDPPDGRAEKRGKGEGPRQYRRVDAYLSARTHEIVMNPGAVAGGAAAVTTQTHHRPLQDYVSSLAAEGFGVTALEEWASRRKSEPGPRAAEEDRARREIPMFLAIRAVLLPKS